MTTRRIVPIAATTFALIATTLGLSVGTSLGVANAADAPLIERPVGNVVIRVDGGGNARVVDAGGGRFRMILPKNASIQWLGATQTRDVAIGNFKAGRLAQAWQSIGHRRTTGVVSTLTWRPNGSTTQWASAKVSDPRVNARGRLVLTVRSTTLLPPKMPRYTINITRAAQTTRSFPVTGPAVQLSGSVFAQATAQSATSSTGSIYSDTGNCFSYSHSTTVNARLLYGGTCGGIRFSTPPGTYGIQSTSQIQIGFGTDSIPGVDGLPTTTKTGSERGNFTLYVGQDMIRLNVILRAWTEDGTLIQ
jgi:hypothetical protein